MIDRELLELAAKAGGIPFDPIAIGPGGARLIRGNVWWNPLTDDGDALRLAVKLRMTVKATEYGAAAYKDDLYRLVALGEATSIEAATRRAIVRAAAEIGRAMK